MKSAHIIAAICALLILSSACSLPGWQGLVGESVLEPTRGNAGLSSSSTPLPPPPPSLVETAPLPGETLPPYAAIRLYFDQSMNARSVEAAFQVSPTVPGAITWPESSTLEFRPEEPLERDTVYEVTIGTQASSSSGLTLAEPILARFQTAGDLKVTQVLPAPDSTEIDPAGLISVAFNRPVVPLQIGGVQLDPLEINPPAEGDGEWVDSSLYLFRPSAPLQAGRVYEVSLPDGLTGADGSSLASGFSWSFRTALPRLLAMKPAPASQGVGRDTTITLTFNQAMRPDSFETALQLLAPDGQPVGGKLEWNEARTEFAFKPDGLLEYDTPYQIVLLPAFSAGGAPLSQSHRETFRTVAEPAVVSTLPADGGVLPAYQSLKITFTGSMDAASLRQALQVTPEVESLGVHWSAEENAAYVNANFLPGEAYELVLGADASDVYGTPLEAAFRLSMRAGDLPPSLSFSRFNQVLTLPAEDLQQVEVQARNIGQVQLGLRSISLNQFFELANRATTILRDPPPVGNELRAWAEPVPEASNVSQRLTIQLGEAPLATGAYLLTADAPDDNQPAIGRLLLVRGTELVLKSTADRLFIWAVDLAAGMPSGQSSVRLLDGRGQIVGQAITAQDGVAEMAHEMSAAAYAPLYAQIGEPGSEDFGLTNWTWTEGISSYEFGVGLRLTRPDSKAYVYTDRPLYRPGDRVYYRGVLRLQEEARYQLPVIDEIDVRMLDAEGEVADRQTASLSEYGTFDGSFLLPPSSTLGFYAIETDHGSVFFDVAAYRKPEFLVELSPSADQVVAGEQLSVVIDAQYFFGGPLADARVAWSAFLMPSDPPHLPRPVDWFGVYEQGFGQFSNILAEGEIRTGADGSAIIEIPTRVDHPRPFEINIEATISEVGDLPVTGRTSVQLHPAEVYVSLLPERYALANGEDAVIRLVAADPEGEPVGRQLAKLEVARITWEQSAEDDGSLRWQARRQLVNRGTVRTEADGQVLVSFTPELPGSYEIRAESGDGSGRQATSIAKLWVAGPGLGLWRQPAAGRIALVADKLTYRPGEIAELLIPSPFEDEAMALVTLERGSVVEYRLVEVAPGGSLIELPILRSHSPNVFVSAILVHPGSETAQASVAAGLIELQVNSDHLRLQVEMTPSQAQVGPGEELTYSLRVTDSSGDPVQAELSLALVDRALLALSRPNSPEPFDAFYGRQPLGVRTAASLALSASGGPAPPAADGRGGGGDGAIAEIRQDFRDTAYWNASIVTDAAGRAQVRLRLPDNLTTWRMQARGIDRDSLAGSASVDVVASKPLLIRPLTPRFFTAGDEAVVAAVVHNNTSETLDVQVLLSAQGAELLDPAGAELELAAGGSQRFEWRARIRAVEFVELTFSVQGGGYQDATRPTVASAGQSGIPVLRYSAPDTSASAGELAQGGVRTEVLHLPRRFDASQGSLEIQLETSLGAAALRAAEVVSHYPYASTEQLASEALSASAVLRASETLAPDSATALASLEGGSQASLLELRARQNPDGGWGWWNGLPSDRYITAYTLLALLEAKALGQRIPEDGIDSSIAYLQAGTPPPDSPIETRLLDREAFAAYVLSRAGATGVSRLQQLAGQRQRLSMGSRALLARGLSSASPGDPLITALMADLESQASRSATGAHWQPPPAAGRSLQSSVVNTAHVISATAMVDPDNPLLADAVRWLVHSRRPDGSWATSHETAWALSALSDWAAISGHAAPDYSFRATLNGTVLIEGSAAGDDSQATFGASRPVAELTADRGNQLAIERNAGSGGLYYTAHLEVFRPVEDVPATQHGLSIERSLFHFDGRCGAADNPCPPAESVAAGDDILVRLTLVVPSDQYYLAVNDPFPAGMEPIDPRLETSPGEAGWFGLPLLGHVGDIRGAGRFDSVELHDDHVALFAEFLPAGTYHYTYRLHASYAGEYRLLPARAWAVYFPEVYGHTAGEMIVIGPSEIP